MPYSGSGSGSTIRSKDAKTGENKGYGVRGTGYAVRGAAHEVRMRYVVWDTDSIQLMG